MNVSAADICFWGLESPTSHQAIALYNLLDGCPEADALRLRLESACQYFPKLSLRRVSIHSTKWAAVPRIDFDYHLQFHRLDGPWTPSALHNAAEQEFSQGLDLEKPLWRIVVLSHPETNQTVLLYLIHHSLADGMSGMALFYTLCDLSRDSKNQLNQGALRSFRKSANWKESSAATSMLRIARDGISRAWVDELHIQNSSHRRLLTIAVPLDEIQTLRNTNGLSLNEVFLLCATNGLRAHFAALGHTAPDCAALIPVNLRNEQAIEALGNHLSAVRIILPVGEQELEKQVALLKSELTGIQESGSFGAYAMLSSILAALPSRLRRKLLRSAAHRIDCICTNAPGPKSTRWIAGAQILETYGIPALMHSQSLGFAAVRYKQHLHIAIVYDAAISNGVAPLASLGSEIERFTAPSRTDSPCAASA